MPGLLDTPDRTDHWVPERYVSEAQASRHHSGPFDPFRSLVPGYGDKTMLFPRKLTVGAILEDAGGTEQVICVFRTIE